MNADPDRRYGVGARWFHWATAVLVFIAIPLGWIYGGFKTKPHHPDTYVAPFPGTPDDYASAHFTVGLLILAVVAARILYRAKHPPPAWPGASGRVDAALSRMTHGMLYAVLIIMPVSGYIMMAGDKPPIVLLGWFDLPKLPATPNQGFAAAVVHVYTQFAVYALILLHLAGTAWHLFIRRDDLLSRIFPHSTFPMAEKVASMIFRRPDAAAVLLA